MEGGRSGRKMREKLHSALLHTCFLHSSDLPVSVFSFPDSYLDAVCWLVFPSGELGSLPSIFIVLVVTFDFLYHIGRSFSLLINVKNERMSKMRECSLQS